MRFVCECVQKLWSMSLLRRLINSFNQRELRINLYCSLFNGWNKTKCAPSPSSAFRLSSEKEKTKRFLGLVRIHAHRRVCKVRNISVLITQLAPFFSALMALYNYWAALLHESREEREKRKCCHSCFMCCDCAVWRYPSCRMFVMEWIIGMVEVSSFLSRVHLNNCSSPLSRLVE